MDIGGIEVFAGVNQESQRHSQSIQVTPVRAGQVYEFRE